MIYYVVKGKLRKGMTWQVIGRFLWLSEAIAHQKNMARLYEYTHVEKE